MAPCLPCCATPEPPVCGCALFVPSGLLPPYSADPYDNYTDAKYALDNYSADCLGFCYVFGGTNDPSLITTFTVDDSTANQLDVTAIIGTGSYVLLSITASAGTLTVPYLIQSGATFKSFGAKLLDCEGTEIDNQVDVGGSGDLSGTFTFTIADPAEYLIMLTFYSEGVTITNATASVIGSGTMIGNPVEAFYDSGTPGEPYMLEACPRLFLPLLTELTGDWYANLASAEAELASAQVSNCVGFAAYPIFEGISTFSAVEGSGILTLNGTWENSTGGGSAVTPVGSISGLAGDTLSVGYDVTTSIVGGPADNDGKVEVTIYDYSGIELYYEEVALSAGGGTGTINYVLPYSGRYTVVCKASGPTGLLITSSTLDATFEITSSGTMTVNPVQALYDVGVGCPARLDCVT